MVDQRCRIPRFAGCQAWQATSSNHFLRPQSVSHHVGLHKVSTKGTVGSSGTSTPRPNQRPSHLILRWRHSLEATVGKKRWTATPSDLTCTACTSATAGASLACSWRPSTATVAPLVIQKLDSFDFFCIFYMVISYH